MRLSVDTIRSWIIVGACFYVQLIVSGTVRMSGIFFVASMPRYNVGRSAASFPYTFVNFINFVSGPLFGYLGQKFGIHKILITGSLLSTIGLGACFFIEDIRLICLFYGVVFGLGCGSCLLLPLLINQHFIKYRAVASGLRTSGKSFGSFILPPFTEILLDKYGLSGTFLVLSGLVFNCLPATLLFRTMKFDTIAAFYPSPKCSDEEKQPLLKGENTIKVYSENLLKQNNKNTLNDAKQFNTRLNSQYPKGIEIPNESGIISSPLANNKNLEESQQFYIKNVINNKDKLDFSKKDSNKDFDGNKLESNKSIYPNANNLLISHKSSCSVILDPAFLCLAITRSFYFFILTCLTTVMVDFASDIGIPEHEQEYTIMIYSVGELIGPLGLGWLIDKSYFEKTTFLAITCYLQALISVCVAFSNGSIMLFGLLGVFGFVHSVETFVTPLLVADYISEAKQIVAMTSISFLAAPLCLLVSPLIGFLRDVMGSYEFMFYGLGILSAISGSLIVMIPCFIKGKSKT